MRTPVVHVDLASATVEGRRMWRAELSIDGRPESESEWTFSVADAVRDCRDLRFTGLSKIAYDEARHDAYELFARAS